MVKKNFNEKKCERGYKGCRMHSLVPLPTAMRKSCSLLLTWDSVSSPNQGLQVVTTFSGSGLEFGTWIDYEIINFFSRAGSVVSWGISSIVITL